MVNAEEGSESTFIQAMADQLKQPQFYITLKVSRYGEDKKAIKTSVAGDQAACEKIAADINQDAKVVWREFIGQLNRWRSTFAQWNVPNTPEDIVISSLKNIMSQNYVGKTVRLAVFISMDKTKTANSATAAKFRWMSLLVENDKPGAEWEVKRVIHWGNTPAIEFGVPYNIVLVEKGDFTTLTEFALSDKKLPEKIPGDIRARCKLIALGQPYTRRGTGPSGDYELEGIYVTLLVDNGDGTSKLVEGSSLKPEAWAKAEHGVIISTTITEKKGFINIGDFHEAKDQSPISNPKNLPLVLDLSDEAAVRYMDDFIIYDGVPGKYWVAEGEKGPVYLLTIESFFSSQTTVRIMESADISKGLMKTAGDRTRVDAHRIRVLCKIQQYTKNGKMRLSRTAYAIWAVDEAEAEERIEEIILPGKEEVPQFEESNLAALSPEEVIPEGFKVDREAGKLVPVEPEEAPVDKGHKPNYAEDPLLDRPFAAAPKASRANLEDLGAPLTAPEPVEEKPPARKPRFLGGEITEETVL
jgi:hypothetical protein